MYVPHPFDRMHSVPDYEHLLNVVEDIDAIEIFNPRVAFSAFNEEAARFAAKYRIVAGAGSDSHVAQGLGSVKIRMRDFDGPEEFLESLREADIIRRKQSLLYVQALKFIQTKGGTAGGKGGKKVMRRRGARRASSKAPGERMPATDDEIKEKYLERAIRELNALTREIQSCDLCPRGNLMPVLGSGHPQADIFLLKFAPMPSEIEEGVAFYGRAGGALMKSFKRLGIDPLTVYGTVFVKCPVGDTDDAAVECRARVLDELAVVQPRIVVVMGDDALEELNGLAVPLGPELEALAGEIQKLTPPATPSGCPTSTPRWTTRGQAPLPGKAFRARSATGTPTSLPTSPSRNRRPRAQARAPPRRRYGASVRRRCRHRAQVGARLGAGDGYGEGPPTRTACSPRLVVSARSCDRRAATRAGLRPPRRPVRCLRAEGRQRMAEKAQVLVVANQTAESEELLAALKGRADQGPVEFTVLIPATPLTAWPGRRTCSPARRRRATTATR